MLVESKVRVVITSVVCLSVPAATVFSTAGVSSATAHSTEATVATADAQDDARCRVRLHGKSGSGGDTTIDDAGVANVFPNGNAEGWGGRQWLYFPDDNYEAARQIVADAVADCDVIILNGFSNGGSFAAKMYCRGETFDGRLLRVVVDDPVPDAGVVECQPDVAVELVVYWTGAIEGTARPGWDCTEGDWTCEGGTTIGIDAYADELGAQVQDSPFDEHQWHWDAPELSEWSPLLDGSASSTAPVGLAASISR